MAEYVLKPAGAAGSADPGAVSGEQVEQARALLDRLPFPVLWIGPDCGVRWRNETAARSYGRRAGPCHRITHGYGSPCDRHGEPCPMRRAVDERRAVSVAHVHPSHDGPAIYKVTAIPVDDGGALEIQWPLDDIVVRDSLTGVHARRFFEQIVRRELELMKRMGQPFSLVLIDVDRLKEINDQHGHAAGDAALREVGRCLLASARGTDVVGRLGGDEFALFLPGTRKSNALALARRVRAALGRVHLAGPAPQVRLTASFGIHGGSEGFDLEAALAAADGALYRAKASGRDCMATS